MIRRLLCLLGRHDWDRIDLATIAINPGDMLWFGRIGRALGVRGGDVTIQVVACCCCRTVRVVAEPNTIEAGLI